MICFLPLLHSLGAFGFFKMSFLGLEYDTYVHFTSALVIGIAAFNYTGKFPSRILERIFIALLITLGFGLLNELIEYAGYAMFGTGEGFFRLGPGDIGATNAYENLMTDFFNDFRGNMAGIAAGAVYALIWKRQK